MNQYVRVEKKLNSFPLSTVKSTATFYNKAFHSKVFTLFASSESEVYSFAKRHSPHYGFCFAFMKNDEGQWYLDIKGIQKIRNWVINQARRGSQQVSSLHKKWQRDWQKYLKLADQLNNLRLKELSDQAFYKVFEEFYLQYLSVGSVAYIADSFMSTGEHDWLEVLLTDELKRLKVNFDKRVAWVRDLTSPVHLSFTLEAEYRLLKIGQKLVNRFSYNLPSFNVLKTKSPLLYQSLKKHARQYHWIENNYYNVHYVSATEFYRQILNLVSQTKKDKTSLQELLKEKQTELGKMRQTRQKLIDSMSFSRFIRNILAIARLFAKWKDIRKSGVYIGMHYFDLFLSEVARRTHYTKEQLTFLVFDEIKDLLIKRKNLTAEINDRQKQCFFAVSDKGYFLASGKKAEKYFKFALNHADTDVTEIKGVAASPGKVIGRVRVIKKTGEMKDFKFGEILVTNQTTPEFVPIMKKAAAIVTEQGGITSHAAIVSRELKKPCVIGTKIATSVLLNGEMVEVDAETGVIKRLL